jgi:hypothetical protein
MLSMSWVGLEIILWPNGVEMQMVMEQSKYWCSLWSVSKEQLIKSTFLLPSFELSAFANEYYYFKRGHCYHVNVTQTIVDCSKTITNLLLGFLGLINESQVL